VVDTNIWISSLFGKSVKNGLLKVLLNNHIELYSCQRLNDEITNILKSNKIAKYTLEKERQLLIQYFVNAVKQLN